MKMGSYPKYKVWKLVDEMVVLVDCPWTLA